MNTIPTKTKRIYKKRSTTTNDKDKLLTRLDVNTDINTALQVINNYILNPYHSVKYEHLTYVDEVVLLCLLKGVKVEYNREDFEYYLEEANVSSSIDKLIGLAYIDYQTLAPNKIVLRRVYLNHPFAIPGDKMATDSGVKTFLNYYVVTDLEQARSKWKASNFINTIYRAMTLPRFKDERISFCTFINIVANKPRLFPSKKDITKYQLFDLNVARLHMITSVLLKEIQALL